jgi:hypothetical protein
MSSVLNLREFDKGNQPRIFANTFQPQDELPQLNDPGDSANLFVKIRENSWLNFSQSHSFQLSLLLRSSVTFSALSCFPLFSQHSPEVPDERSSSFSQEHERRRPDCGFVQQHSRRK